MIEKEYQFIEYRMGKGSKKVFGCELKNGVKVEVRDFILKEMQSNEYITSRFQLNIKRINRWWYSVYFKELIK